MGYKSFDVLNDVLKQQLDKISRALLKSRVEWGNTGHFCLESSCDGVFAPISINKHSLERLFIWQHFCHTNLVSGFNILQARSKKAKVLFF